MFEHSSVDYPNRFAMWLFGFEPGDGEDKWRKWQARQKVLRANEDRPGVVTLNISMKSCSIWPRSVCRT